MTALADPAPADTNGSNQEVAGLERYLGAAEKLAINDAREDIEHLRRGLQRRTVSEAPVFAHIIEYQKLLNREAREDKALRVGEVLDAIRARVPVCRSCNE